jgi:tRNA modification GTPase
MLDDTIAAISTPPGEGGIGIVRISGPDAFAIGHRLFRFARRHTEPQSHTMYYGHVVHPRDGNAVDEALIVFMAAPRTFTREDVVEIHCHGGILPLAKTLELALAQGARSAMPGEFTRRAFLNGRIDLAQAEAVIQIIRARTATAMELGMAQLQGRLSAEIRSIRRHLLSALAHLEASIDFPEHQDVEDMARLQLREGAAMALARAGALLDTADQGRILREGVRTAIIGRPNVGKSSLLNALLGQQRAIVTNIPGTTRDILEESLNLGGVVLTIVDTAGIREAADEVEKLGVERSRGAIDMADLILYVLDVSQGIADTDREILDSLGDRPCILILNKTDLADDEATAVRLLQEHLPPYSVVPMSLLEKQGLPELEKEIIALVFQGEVRAPESAMVTTTRHKDAIRRAADSLQDMLTALDDGFAVDLLAIDLHNALEALGEITGETVGADLADEIFRTFCIGK